MDAATFNKLYWDSKSPEINRMFAAIKDVTDQGVRQSIAQGYGASLAAQGRTGPADLIDNAIMVWVWDPYVTMGLRQQDGYAWVPSALTPPVEIAPGLFVPGMPSYDPDKPPKLAIKVSLDPLDYPSWKA